MICGCCENLGFFSFGFCPACLRQKRKVRLPNEDADLLKALFFYEGAAKALILAAKIGHDANSIKFLTKVFSRSQLVKHACRRNDLILPVPSSLWSRFYGRLDLAYALAFRASQDHGLSITKAPFSYGWHLKKQAHRRNRVILAHHQPICLSKHRVLLIDDVRTSGHTLRTIQAHLKARSVEAITLARTKE